MTVNFLIEKGADVNTKTSLSTALITACERNYIKIIKLLMKNGADVNGTPKNSKTTPLITAAFRGNTTIVRLLVEKYNACLKTQGKKALKQATKSNHLEVPLYLIRKGVGKIETINAEHFERTLFSFEDNKEDSQEEKMEVSFIGLCIEELTESYKNSSNATEPKLEYSSDTNLPTSTLVKKDQLPRMEIIRYILKDELKNAFPHLKKELEKTIYTFNRKPLSLKTLAIENPGKQMKKLINTYKSLITGLHQKKILTQD